MQCMHLIWNLYRFNILIYRFRQVRNRFPRSRYVNSPRRFAARFTVLAQLANYNSLAAPILRFARQCSIAVRRHFGRSAACFAHFITTRLLCYFRKCSACRYKCSSGLKLSFDYIRVISTMFGFLLRVLVWPQITFGYVRECFFFVVQLFTIFTNTTVIGHQILSTNVMLM